MTDENEMPSEDDFMEIIHNSDLEEYISNSPTHQLTLRDMHVGIKNMAEALMYMTSFIDEFYTACTEGEEEDRPGFSLETITFLINIYENAEKFCASIEFEEEDEEEDIDDEDE